MMRRFLTGLLVGLCGLALFAPAVGALGKDDKGLYISPLRQEVTVRAGETRGGSFTVANYFDKPITLDFSFQQFSVSDFTYDYTFRSSHEDWVSFPKAQLRLEPGQKEKVRYTVSVPGNAAPGGHYFALFASADVVQGEGQPTTVRATSLLYLQVQGELVRTSVLKNETIPLVVMSREVPYRFDVQNTGNTHFSANFYGQASSLFGAEVPAGTGHLIMPGTIRSIKGATSVPIWPGVYKVTYGYKVDFADFVNTKTAYVLYVPPWSIAALVLVLFAAVWLWQRRHRIVK